MQESGRDQPVKLPAVQQIEDAVTSLGLHPKAEPTPTPSIIIQKMTVQAAITAGPPTLTIFLKLNSKPKAKSRKMTPMSAQTFILALSITEGV